jgi:hypothetical protein
MKTVMQNGNNNMDNKLRQLENQSLPDLSKQDKHWQDMKQMLAPEVVPAKPAGKFGIWKWFVAAGVAVGVVLLFDKLSTSKKTSVTAPVSNVEDILKEETTPQNDTDRKVLSIADTIAEPVLTVKINPSLKPPAGNRKKVFASMAAAPCDNCGTDWLNKPLPDTINQLPENATGPKATLASFFAQLEKPAQEFVIDPKKDEVVYGKDGTALFIPANTFNTLSKVTLVLKEYYSYEDIITNKLSTTSNGQQLVTGGMIHLVAMANGKEVDMEPNRAVKWFIPDTSANMQGMRLFKGIENKNRQLDYSSTATKANANGEFKDTIAHDERYDDLNWIPQNIFFESSLNSNRTQNPQVRVIDLRDYPYKITTRKKTKAYYYLYEGSHLSKEEVATYLKARNKWYDKIIIRKTKHDDDWCTYKGLYGREIGDCYTSLGDTMTISARLANIYKLKIIDTVRARPNTWKGNPADSTQSLLFGLNNKYGVDVTTLGWINCDRFYYNNNERVPYIVDLKDTASNYYTILVFDRMKSMMTGSVAGNKVMFANLPKGETAKVISVGIKEGKAVSAMESVAISRTPLSSLKFEETTPSAFRQQAATMDK